MSEYLGFAFLVLGVVSLIFRVRRNRRWRS